MDGHERPETGPTKKDHAVVRDWPVVWNFGKRRVAFSHHAGWVPAAQAKIETKVASLFAPHGNVASRVSIRGGPVETCGGRTLSIADGDGDRLPVAATATGHAAETMSAHVLAGGPDRSAPRSALTALEIGRAHV